MSSFRGEAARRSDAPRAARGRAAAGALLVIAVAAARADGTASGAPDLVSSSAEDLLREVRRPGARAVVVNVWATWCAPCREEMPDVLRVYRELRERGVRLLLVSADFPEAREEARAFLSRAGVDFPTYLKSGDDRAFIDGLDPSWSGALPATFVYDATGKLRHSRVGKSTYAELRERVLEALEGTGASTEEPS